LTPPPVAHDLTADAVIRLLDLKPHPEGGHFRETFRDARQIDGGRASSTAIYFLLARGERSHWHRIDAAEVWHWYAGAPLELEFSRHHGQIERVTLGSNLSAGERPQAVVPAHAWQAAQSLGAWTLCGCTVSPGFDFAVFELAPKDWTPR
jgi:predicted cupin superfamily sugar epimerase